MSDSTRLTFTLALRNIFRNKRRTALMVLLIASGLAAMMVTDGFTRGMTQTMIAKVTGNWLGQAQVHAAGYRDDRDAALYIKDTAPAVAILASEPGVAAFAQRTFAGGMVASSNNVAPAAIIGIELEQEAQVSTVKAALFEGSYLQAGDKNGILIGKRMADLLEVRLGDRIVTTLSEAHTGELSQRLFRVQGILKFEDRTMDQQMAFVTLKAGQDMSAIGPGVHEIAIRLDPALAKDETAATLARLTKAFDGLDITSEKLEFLDWKGLVPEFAGVLEMSGMSAFIVGGILFVLVSLGLINSMFMSIYERHYEFGVMLGLGTRRRILFGIICFEGTLIGFFGALLGLIIGGAGSWWLSQNGIYFGEFEMSGVTMAEPMKTMLTLQQFTLFPVFVVGLAALACIIPGLHGARLVPAIALRRAL